MTPSGSGSRLPTDVLVLAGVSAVVAVLVSTVSIVLQLKNYRKPILQRMVVRIMLMVPLYAISSLISIFSLEAAFVIDAIRDIYEVGIFFPPNQPIMRTCILSSLAKPAYPPRGLAFVIYCFFELLLAYLGGERSLLIMLHGRPPKDPVFPVNLFKREIDVSDPYTFLFLKRGIIQYVQVKPILAAATLILKGLGKYNDGNFRANSGYLYVSVVYNISICLALYCLAIFWLCVNEDLKPFRPVPKFLCVKGILFFSFWQSIGISLLVATHVIKKLGPYDDAEHISLGLTDTLICLEMPIFAIAHNYAFSYKDFIDPRISFVARMPFYYAFRDAFGALDVIEDSKATLRGEGMDYREFEPAEGVMHQGLGRERRIRAGLRYSKGGQHKYWLPKSDSGHPGRTERAVNRAIVRVAGPDQAEEVYAPLLPHQAENVVHLAPDLQQEEERHDIWENRCGDSGEDGDDGFELPFGDLDEADEELFSHSKQYVFGDYNYPCIDVSSEHAKVAMWSEEERILRNERGAWFSPLRGAKGRLAMQGRNGPAWEGYGAVGNTVQPDRHQHGHTLGLIEEGNGKVIDLNDSDDGSGHSQTIKLHWTRTPPTHSTSASPSRAVYPQPSSSLQSKSKTRSNGPISGIGSTAGPSSAGNSSGSRRNNVVNVVKPASSISTLNRVRSPYNLTPCEDDGSRRSLSRPSSRGSPTTVLPPDAVDLVVEDNEAAEKGQVKERRKGEPATRGLGLRKVYRRGFEVETLEGDTAKGEVEVANEEGVDRGRMNVGERALDAIERRTSGDDHEGPGSGAGDYRRQERASSASSGTGSVSMSVSAGGVSLGDVWEPRISEDVVIARVRTPPVHARIDDDDVDQEENPWA